MNGLKKRCSWEQTNGFGRERWRGLPQKNTGRGREEEAEDTASEREMNL